MTPYWQSPDHATLYAGDCLEVMAALPENSVDSIITDPPYGLSAGPTRYLGDEGARGGFMGKTWDHGVPGIPYWQAALRVAKPGAILLAFGGTRTFHRLVCAIEDAGWQVRDTIAWVYASGFPKSLNISKALDAAAGAEREVIGIGSTSCEYLKRGESCKGHRDKGQCQNGETIHVPITAPATDAAREWDGWGSSLKPSFEPICLAMKPLDGTFAQNALKWGVAGLAIDKCRIGNEKLPEVMRGVSRLGTFEGADGNVTPKRSGRWPANLAHDGSDEVVEGFPSPHGAGFQLPPQDKWKKENHNGVINWGTSKSCGYRVGDSGSAARFFYCAKASRAEREEGCEGLEKRDGLVWNSGGLFEQYRQAGIGQRKNIHPTCKPLALMEWLCRLTSTPTGGLVLDPFCGSGTTGVACARLGRQFIGIDLSEEYLDIAKARIAHALAPLTEGIFAEEK